MVYSLREYINHGQNKGDTVGAAVRRSRQQALCILRWKHIPEVQVVAA